MKIRVTVDLDVDTEAWATAYGMQPAEVVADAWGYLPEVVAEAVGSRGLAIGTFSVVGTSAAVLAGSGR